MKFRSDFVTNSSSSSFIISKRFVKSKDELYALLKDIAELRNKVMSKISNVLPISNEESDNWFRYSSADLRAKLGKTYNEVIEILMNSKFKFEESASKKMIDDIIDVYYLMFSNEKNMSGAGYEAFIDDSEILDMSEPLKENECSSFWGRAEVLGWYLGLLDNLFDDSGDFDYNAYSNCSCYSTDEKECEEFDKLYEEFCGMENPPKENEYFEQSKGRFVIYGSSEYSVDFAFAVILEYFCTDYCTHMG